jgi:hypothetical protein
MVLERRPLTGVLNGMRGLLGAHIFQVRFTLQELLQR